MTPSMIADMYAVIAPWLPTSFLRRALLVAVAILTTVACQSGPQPGEAADIVILDARVWTGTDETAGPTSVEAIAIRNGLIVKVGDRESVARLAGPQTTTLSLPGRLVLPGFIDGHVHPLGAGRQQFGCSLQEEKTVAAVLAKVKSCHDAAAHNGADKSAVVFGRGFDLSLFKDANPNKSLLDEISRERPLYFRGADGHSGWANSAALALAGITKDTPDPAHGKIERDADGTPSGTLREDAIELVEEKLPKPTLQDDVKALRWAVERLSAAGITSVMDAGVDERRLEAWLALAQQGALDVDVVACIVVDPATPQKSLEEARDLRSRFDGKHPRLQVTATKIYLDGVLEGETAALLHPYDTHPEHKGSINATPQLLNETVALLEKDGFQVHMHVIGDAASRAALDAYAFSRSQNADLKDTRGTLAHLQLVDPTDYARFKALGVVVNAQSLWAYPDTYITGINTPQVGQARVDRMYPWGSLARAGARVVGGSDWPVSSEDPLDAIEVMVRRQDPELASGPVLGTGEELDLTAALRAYTREAAFLIHQDGQRGQIAPGFAADVVILDTDIAAGAPRDINAAKVLFTIKNGVVVFKPVVKAGS